MDRRRPAVAASLVALAAFAFSAPGLRRVLVWDDVYLFARDDLYLDPSRLSEALTSPLGKETGYWRPLGTTSFLLESLVHGGVAEGFRTTSALIHAAAAALAFFAVLRVARSIPFAALGALAFALHPVTVETTTWISARFDLLAGLFTLGAMVLAADGAVSRPRLAAVGACCAAATLSKESGATSPIVAAAWAAMACVPAPGEIGSALRRAAPAALAGFAGVGLAVVARIAAVGAVAPAVEPGAGLSRVGAAAFEAARVLWEPWTAAPIHAGPDSAAGIAVGFVVLLGIAGLALAAWRRRPVTACALLAFAAAYVPASQIVPASFAGGAAVADRFLYVPCMVLCGLLAVSAARGAQDAPKVAILVGAGVAAVLGVHRVRTVLRWNDPVTLWTWAADRAPESTYARSQLARALLGAGNLEAAEAEAQRARRDDPLLLAEIQSARGRDGAALATLDEALIHRPADTQSRLLRAELRLRLGQAVDAARDFELVAAAEAGTARYLPIRPVALAGAARAYAVVGSRAEAESAARRAELDATATDERAWTAIARAWFAAGRIDEGLTAAARARTAGADEEPALELEIDGLREAGRPTELAARLRRLLELRPSDVRALDDLGYTLWETGDVAGAEKAFRDALAADAGFGWARFHLAVLLERTGRAADARTELDRARADAKSRDDGVLLRRIDEHAAEERPPGGR